MKIIDLLNKIANGEEIPKTFEYNNYIFNLGDDKRYRDQENDYLADSIRYDFENLNEEIKIIKDKKVENLKVNDFGDNKDLDEVDDDIYFIIDKINEIIDRLNKEK